MRFQSKIHGAFQNRRLDTIQITAPLHLCNSKLSSPLCHFLLCEIDEHLISMCEWNRVRCHWVITVALKEKRWPISVELNMPYNILFPINLSLVDCEPGLVWLESIRKLILVKLGKTKLLANKRAIWWNYNLMTWITYSVHENFVINLIIIFQNCFSRLYLKELQISTYCHLWYIVVSYL